MIRYIQCRTKDGSNFVYLPCNLECYDNYVKVIFRNEQREEIRFPFWKDNIFVSEWKCIEGYIDKIRIYENGDICINSFIKTQIKKYDYLLQTELYFRNTNAKDPNVITFTGITKKSKNNK